MEKIALVAIAYNRTQSLQRLLASLSSAHYDGESVPLYISVDKSGTDEVERFAHGYEWAHGQKTVVTHAENMGLRRHILSQGRLLEDYDAVVILEDDLVVAPDFWSYVRQTVARYKDEPSVAGISLYSFAVAAYNQVPFTPMHDGHDAYFMDIAMSWGEVWMRRQWHDFELWYAGNKDFDDASHLPPSLYRWGKKSWLRYHTRYCMEQGKRFVHPYVSYTTNFSDVGTHVDTSDSLFQVPLLAGRTGQLRLPAPDGETVHYDGFYENRALYGALGMGEEECCLDLMGINANRERKRYWLTTRRLGYRIVRSFGCAYRPIEQNVLADVPGRDIYLYDTTQEARNAFPGRKDVMLYTYKIQNALFWLRDYGLGTLLREFVGTARLALRRNKGKR